MSVRSPAPFRLPARPLGLLAACCVAAALTCPAAEPSPAPAAAASEAAPSYRWENDIWRRASELLVDEALTKLPATATDAAERRRLDYTRGVLLLNAQPKLQGNIDQARDLLESVRKTRADDDTGLSALYFLARIAQFHTEPRDPARAATLYTELIALAPDHPLAQEAVSRLAVIRLYEEVPPGERLQRFYEFEAAANRLTLPSARRDAHFALAEVFLLLTDDRESVLRHLVAAEEAGILRQQLAADTTARIAVLARELGHRDIAVAHYKKFLTDYQRDARAYMLGEQLKALEAEPAATPTPTPSDVPAAPPASATPNAPAASTDLPAATPTPTPPPPPPRTTPPPPRTTPPPPPGVPPASTTPAASPDLPAATPQP